MQRVLFAFSGGVDDILSVHWLRQSRGYQVLAFLADLGQGGHSETLGELALECGAAGTVIVDLRERFIQDYIYPTLRSGAHYEGYLLATPLARSLISEHLVRLAIDEGIEIVAHGGSSRGNDQVRFEAAVAALDPSLTVMAPMRELSCTTMAEKIRLLDRTNIVQRPEFMEDVSRDVNLWGSGQVHGGLSDPWKAPPEDLYLMTQSLARAPDQGVEVVIAFERGVPTAIDGEKLEGIDLIAHLNRVAGEHGIGRLDHLENRMLGGKTREIYESPGATVLYAAHQALEELTQARDLFRYKRVLAEEYGRLVYQGLWFSELREALDCFFESTQRYVTGRVRVQLYKGNAVVTGRKSRYSLYDARLADSPEGEEFMRGLAKGFVDVVTQAQKGEASHRRPR